MLGPFATPPTRQVLVAVAFPTPSALDAASLLAVVVAPQMVASVAIFVVVPPPAAARQMLREVVVPRQILREVAAARQMLRQLAEPRHMLREVVVLLREVAAARQMLRQLAVPRQMLREVALHLAVHRLAAAAQLLCEDVVTLFVLHLVAGQVAALVLTFALLVAPGSLLAGQVAVMHSCM